MYRHAFFVTTALYGFYTFLMLCLHMKYFRDGIDEDDRGRLAQLWQKPAVQSLGGYMGSLLTGIKFGGEQLEKFRTLSMFWNMNSSIS